MTPEQFVRLRAETCALALRDALQTARVRLADECDAYLLCRSRGFDSDARNALRERQRYEAEVARLEARLRAEQFFADDLRDLAE